MKPIVSILITTFNRKKLLKRSLNSVLKQTFKNFEVIVIDDHSSDGTKSFMEEFLKKDKRIKYIYNKTNMASKKGDRSIFQKFVKKLSQGTYFVWLCDDDYWVSRTQLERQINIFENNSNISMVMGGMSQMFPKPILKLNKPNEKYLSFEYVGNSKKHIFMRGVYPNGFMSSKNYLELFSKDPSNRNSVTGATLFRRTAFEKANAFKHGKNVRWQSGYLMLAGTATFGDVWYLDEPCVCADVNIESASYRGSQLTHMVDCVNSINAAFMTKCSQKNNADIFFIDVKKRMIKSIVNVYLLNKISYKLGLFNSNNLENINTIFIPHIPVRAFLSVLIRNKCNVTFLDCLVILSSSLSSKFWKLADIIVMNLFKNLKNDINIWPKKLLS